MTADILIQKLVAGGQGLGFLDGKAVFVPGVLPGERVRVRLVRRRRDFDEAVLLQVIAASTHRQTPPCALAGVCGGCDWLHIRYDEQARQKLEIVREAFRRIGRFAWEEIGIESGPELAYRNRVQIHRDDAGRLGFMASGSERIVPVSTCPVSNAGINRIFAGKSPVPSDRSRFTVWADHPVTAVEGLDDERELSAAILGKKILFSVGSFFQSNLAVLEKMVPWVMADLAGAAACDLYCGVGLFGAFLADRFARVMEVESSSTSMSYVQRNVAGASVELYPMSVEQWIDSGAAGAAVDAVVVDPPRAGLSAEVRRWLCHAGPSRLRYVSCNPVTLARDLGELTRGGFVLEDVRVFDFFPQTSHVETAARLHFTKAP